MMAFRLAALLVIAPLATICSGARATGPASMGDLDAALSEWALVEHHRGVSAAVVFPDGTEWVATAGIEPAITIIQPLMNHSSGLGNYTDNPALSKQIAADPNRSFTVSELVDFIPGPAFQRGTGTQYTNTAFRLLDIASDLLDRQ